MTRADDPIAHGLPRAPLIALLPRHRRLTRPGGGGGWLDTDGAPGQDGQQDRTGARSETMPMPRPDWPDQARCAVMLTFDNFGEAFDLRRYGHAGGASADGVYAPRRGVERVLALLDRHRLPATFFVEGWHARRYAGLLREVAAAGHEIAAHGWLHEQWSVLPPERERDLIRRATDALGEALGAPPRGWRAPSGLTTPRTLAYLRDAGYQYDSSFGDEDVPYWVQVDAARAEELIELPWQWSLDDAVYYAYPGAIRRPSEVAALWTEEFDAAYAETGYFMLVCHPRYAGRPARVAALERLIEHIQRHDGLWFVPCAAVAAAARQAPTTPRYPAPAVLPPDEQ